MIIRYIPRDKPHPAQDPTGNHPSAASRGTPSLTVPAMTTSESFNFPAMDGIMLSMKVVLIKDVGGLGKAGEIKEVADGYARNFLLRRNLALPAIRSSFSAIETQLRKEVREQQQRAEELARLAETIEGLSIELRAKVMEEDRLYGSIRDHHIADELKKRTGIDIERTSIELEQPIRQLGSYDVTVRLSRDLTPRIRVVVTQEE